MVGQENLKASTMNFETGTRIYLQSSLAQPDKKIVKQL
jgi:hypothetical protein